MGLLAVDPLSGLSVEPDWVPKLPSANAAFTLSDLINFGLPGDPDPAPPYGGSNGVAHRAFAFSKSLGLPFWRYWPG
jgi:hypothetical protein